MADPKTLSIDLDLLMELQAVRLLEAERHAREAGEDRKSKQKICNAADKAVATAMRDWENTLSAERFDPTWLKSMSDGIANYEASLKAATADLELASSHEAARHGQVRLYSVLFDSLTIEAGRKRREAMRRASRRREQDVLDIHQISIRAGQK